MTADDLQDIRAVVFDAVGTLIYPFPPVAEAYHLAGWSHGSKLPVTQVWRRFRTAFAGSQLQHADLQPNPLPRGEGTKLELRRPPTNEDLERKRWRQIVSEVFNDVPEAGEQIFAMLWQHFALAQHWRLYSDVPAVWTELRVRGYVVGIASNFDERLRGILRGHAPLDCCEALFVSSQLGYPKPAPEFFAGIEEALQLAGDQILLVGDDELNDYQAARAAGWRAIRLQRGSPGARSDSIHTLAQLLDLLKTRSEAS